MGLGLVGWVLPELVTGRQLLPGGAIGLAGLPFVVGLAVALRRHQLFDIERLVNRSLVYGIVLAVLVASYAGLVALLAVVLDLSDTVAAALAAALAALALAPLRGLAQRTVNRLMYGHRDEPARVLNDLGTRLQSVLLPGDVLPAAVEAVADSLRVPYVAVDLADGTGEFRPAAEHGRPLGPRARDAAGAPRRDRGPAPGVRPGPRRPAGRHRPGPDRRAGPAGRAGGPGRTPARGPGPVPGGGGGVAGGRAAPAAARPARRSRAPRWPPSGSRPVWPRGVRRPGRRPGTLLDEIGTEVESSIADVRRVVDALRPPALDELGLVGAVRARAASLAGELEFTVTGPDQRPPLPAAVETAAYRIAVEALTNAARHSQAAADVRWWSR